MKRLRFPFLFLLCVALLGANEPPGVEAEWLAEHLAPLTNGPRLIWRNGDEDRIRKRIATDPITRVYDSFLMTTAEALLADPPLERVVIGRRMLATSRTALKRTTILAYAWRLSGDRRYAQRLERELRAVCAFPDWNPSHFLDTAEMCMAVALGLDWAREELSPEVVKLATIALLEKGIHPSFEPDYNFWLEWDNNWNQVCNAGLTAAALITFEAAPDDAARIVNRMRSSLPFVLETYAPDGVYVEGATYWKYGTEFHVLLLSILESALGTDFGLADYPGFMASPDFLELVEAPSGGLFNYADCGDAIGFNEPMLWFAMKTGEPRYNQDEAIRRLSVETSAPAGVEDRLAVPGFLWQVNTRYANSRSLPLVWQGRGSNPLVVFRTAFDAPQVLYFAAKGGQATLNHGNMDAGSFILELDGVRWAIDPGVQNYHALEEIFQRTGGDLWDRAQDSRRWTLLTKNNFGHNTLSVDHQLHVSDARAEILAFDAERRAVQIDLSAVLGRQVIRALRTVSLLDDRHVEIVDEVQLAPEARTVTWQMLTQAEVFTQPDGVLLRQDGKELRLTVSTPADARFSVISLDPPPLRYDKRIPNLKRLELTIPTWSIHDDDGRRALTIKVTLGSP